MSDTNLNLESTVALAGLVKNLKRPKNFFLSWLFPSIKQFDEREVKWEIEKGRRYTAPFVAYDSEGTVISGERTDAVTVAPPYVKLHRPFRAEEAFVRRAGEAIGGSDTAQNRSAIGVANSSNKMVEMIFRTKESLAVRMIRDGKTVISGEGFSPITIDCKRDPRLSIVIGPGRRWNEDGARMLEDLETAAEIAHEVEGVTITDFVMDAGSWKLLREDAKLQKLIDLRRAFGPAQANIGPMSLAGEGAKLVADLGDFRYWVYSEYEDVPQFDAAGNFTGVVSTQVMTPGFVIGVADGRVEGFQLHGAIMDQRAIDAGAHKADVFLKIWYDDKTGTKFLTGQSSFVPVTMRPNATLSIKVF